MKRLVLGLVLLLALVPAAYAAGPIGFGVHANYANINVAEPLKSIYGPGFGGGVHLDLNFLPFIGVKVSGDYISFSPDNDKYRNLVAGIVPGAIPGNLSIDGGRIGIFSANANAKIGFAIPVITPYATGGIGIASLSMTDVNVTYQGQPLGSIPAAEKETKFSANLGAGVDLNLVAVTLYLEAKYTWIFTEGEKSTYIPVTLGITF